MVIRNGVCPEAINSMSGCVCEAPLSGLKMVCSKVSFDTLRSGLLAAEAPLSLLRLRDTAGLDGSLPDDAFGNLQIGELDLAANGLRQVGIKSLIGQKDSLRILILANNSLTDLPNLMDFASLQVLDGTGNSLSSLSGRRLPGNLYQLRLGRNAICALEPDALSGAKANLVVLDLSENCLTAFPSITVRGAPHLGYLDLSRNAIKELGLRSVVDLPSLLELRLDSNPLSDMALGSLYDLPKLQHLSLRAASLKEILPGVIGSDSTPGLVILDLSENQIQRLPNGALRNLSNLRQVLLDGNRIRAIETGAVVSNAKLQLLSVQNNVVETIESGAFADLPSLLILLLSDNSLPSLTGSAFGQLPALQQIALARNQIASIQPTALKGVEHLTTLDLSRNALVELAPGVLDSVAQLSLLDLRGNKIRSFQSSSLPQPIPNIFLNENPLDCVAESISYLLAYIKANNVRISQPEGLPIVCYSPEPLQGRNIMELDSFRESNDTSTFKDVMGSSKVPAGVPGLGSIPDLSSLSKIPGLNAPLPGLESAARAVPGLASLPGVNALVRPTAGGPSESAIQTLTSTLSRLVTGEKATSADLQDLVNSLPRLAQELPAVSAIDVSKVSPDVIRAFFTGDEIPGLPIPKASRDLITRRVLSQMAVAATAANQGLDRTPTGTLISELLPPSSALPPDAIKSVLTGSLLPTLDSQQTAAIRTYYTKQIARDSAMKTKEESLPVNELMSILNRADLALVPDSVIADIAANRRPNLETLPQVLVDRVRARDPALAERIQRMSSSNSNQGTEKMNIPPHPVRPFPHPHQRKEDVFDLNQLTVETKDPEKVEGSNSLLYTLIAVSTLALVTGVAVAVVCWRRALKEKRRSKALSSLSGASDDPKSLMESLDEVQKMLEVLVKAGPPSLAGSGENYKLMRAPSPSSLDSFDEPWRDSAHYRHYTSPNPYHTVR